MRTLLYLVGLPASGKSTFAKANCDRDTVYVSCDEIRREHPEWTHSHVLGKMERICKESTKNVIYDTTNVASNYRQVFLHRVRNDFDFIEAIVFAVSVEECILRDSKRPENERVGEEVIRKCATRFSMPTLKEGFDKITVFKK